MTTRPHPDALWQALADEAAVLELSHSEIARRAKRLGWARFGPSHVHAVLSGTTPDPRLSTVLGILAGLGRDLPWLDRAIRDRSAYLTAPVTDQTDVPL